jgi:hypothetical protein
MVLNRAVAIVMLVVLLLDPVVARQQTATDEAWNAVKTVPIAKQVEVRLKSGKRLKGELAGVTESAVLLSRKNQITELHRSDISQILLAVSERSRKKSAAAGAGAGAGVAALLFAAGSEGDASAELIVRVVVFCSAVGALIGWAFPTKMTKWVVIYQAK